MSLYDELKPVLPMLCPPGNGVFTVNTAKERKNELHQKLYQSHDQVEEKYLESLKSHNINNTPLLLGVCSDTGGGILRGANWGPLFLRQEILNTPNAHPYFDMGDIRIIPHLLHDKYLNEATIKNCQKSLYEGKDLPVSSLSMTEKLLDVLYANEKSKVFAIGGDHSVSYPLTKTWLKAKKKKGIKTAIIHFDAHTDLLVERLGIDLCFGSWCTHILEYLPAPKNLYQIGIRSSGKKKSHWESTFGVQQFWSKEVKEKGASKIAQNIIEDLKADGIEELYISFDIDAIDSEYAGSTGTPEPDGLSPEEPMIILRALSKEFKITGADMVEIAPFLQTSKKVNPEPDSTLQCGAAISDFLIGALGQS